MPSNCNVTGCKMRLDVDKDIKFFGLPAVRKTTIRIEKLSSQRRAAWIQALGTKDLEIESLLNLKICSKHFVTGRPAALDDETNVDWVPSINMSEEPKYIKQNENETAFDENENEDTILNKNEYKATKNRKTTSQTEIPITIDKLEIEIVRAEGASEMEASQMQVDKKNLIVEEHEREKKPNATEYTRTRKKKKKKKTVLNEDEIMDWIPSEDMYKVQKNTKKDRQIRLPITDHRNEIEIVRAEGLSEMETLQMEMDEKNLIIEEYESEKKQFDGKLEKVINDYEEQLKEKEKIIEQTTRQLTILNGLKLLEASDEKIKYFTGIPDFKLLTALFSYIEDEVSNRPPHDIDHFEGFVLTLTKLRLDLPFQYLSYKYGVPYSKVTKIFHKHITALHQETAQFIKWPDKDDLCEYMPQFYTKFLGPNLVAIIHPIQVLVDTGERYNAVKYIIATSPLGDIIYVSHGFNSQCNDRAIVETCGIIDHLEVDDVVLFLTDMLVNEVVLFKGRKLLAYPKKRNDEHEILDVITKCRNRENLRMQLEKIVGLVQENFLILDHRQPVALYKNHDNKVCIDNVVKVCCALVNLDPTILGSVKLPDFIGKLKIR